MTDKRQHRSYRSIGDAVTALQDRYPDVTPSSLRFLEREGLLTPDRTEGGHRVYTDREIDRVALIKEWQRQRLSLSEIRERLSTSDRLTDPGAISARFLDQALARDLAGAFQTIIAADEAGVPLVVLFGDVLAPALYEIGGRWEQSQLLVAQEKEVSELTRDIIAELTWRHTPAKFEGPSILAGSIQGERHELGLRMVCGLLRASGWNVHYLGADVATSFLLEAVRLHRPSAVLLSVSMDQHLPAVNETTTRLRAEMPGSQAPPVIVGGAATAGHRDELRCLGVTLVEDLRLERVVELLQEIVKDANHPSTDSESEGSR